MAKSLTQRLTLSFGVVSTATLVGIGYFVTAAVDRHFLELDRAELESMNNHVRNALTISGRLTTGEQASRLEEALAAEKGVVVRVTTADGRTVYATPGARFPPNWQRKAVDASETVTTPDIETWEEGDHHFRGTRSRLPIGTADGSAIVSIAVDIDRHHEFTGSFYRTLWGVIAVAVVMTGLLGWLAAGRGLAPVRNMARVARNITASRLAERLKADTLPEELVDLAEAFNAMLARLEDSFRRLSEFSSDLAHELRTPISNLMTQTQVALSRSRSADEYRDVLYSNVEEFERLSRMISDMLFLAKADNGLIVPSRGKVDLASEVRDLFDYYDALVDERGITLVASGEGSVRGDRLMIRRAINNLLSNAVNHSPRGGSVKVRIDKSGDLVEVSVENSGDTIPGEHLDRIFDRFYRVDAARQRLSEGAGLGLAITRSIVAAHGGTVRAFSEAGVTRIELRLPAAAGR